MPPKKKARRSSRAASGLTGNLAEGVTADRSIAPRVDNGLSALENDHWTDEQEAALFKGMVRWKPVALHKENAFIHASSTDSDQHDQKYYPFSLPRDDYAEMMFKRRLAPTGSPSPSDSAPSPSVASTSAAATRRASTVEDTEDPRSSPASIREMRITRKSHSTRSTLRSQLNEVTSLQEQRRNSKASVDEGSVNAQTEDVPQTPGRTEEEEQDEHTELMRFSGTNTIRRRSTRRNKTSK
ncbi:MAG: hypothetical protein Q9188_002936 [Gyalolechia gomerana]